MVLKPLYGGGGSGVVRLKPDDPNLDALLELHAMIGREPVVAQKFIPAVSKGDKRILLVDGEPVGAINRVPAEGQVRSNLARGGRAEAVELTARDQELCAIIGPELKARGLLFVGIDVIGDYMTEINVTSPTGAQQLKRFGGADAGRRCSGTASRRSAPAVSRVSGGSGSRALRTRFLVLILAVVGVLGGLIQAMEDHLGDGPALGQHEMLQAVIGQFQGQIAPPAGLDHGVLDAEAAAGPGRLVVDHA